MKNPITYRTPYATRIRLIAQAGLLVNPGVDAYADLNAKGKALEMAVKGGADRMTVELIAQCRKVVEGLGGGCRPVEAEMVADVNEALNRLANMIQVNDPDPTRRVQP